MYELNPRTNMLPKIKSGNGLPCSTDASFTEVSTLMPILKNQHDIKLKSELMK